MNPEVTKLIQSLELLKPYDDKEGQDCLKTIAFLQSTSFPEAFLRTHLAGHICGSAFLLSADKKSVLLMYHRFLDKWLNFGGHADGNADICSVAVRETIEESGIEDVDIISSDIFDLDIHTIPNRPERNEPQHLHYDIRYLLQAKSMDFHVNDRESKGLKWVSIDDIFSLELDASVRRMAEKWRNYLSLC
jgi:8-oxo-dGTP pyrophosphatase MutT (NUDIX family)